MDFASLAIAPVAAVVTAVALIIALVMKRYREPRSILIALLAALVINAIVFEPWNYAGWKPILTEYALLSTLGFCIGSLVVLAPTKVISALREYSTWQEHARKGVDHRPASRGHAVRAGLRPKLSGKRTLVAASGPTQQ